MTKKMPNLFAKDPPKKPLTTLDAVVDDWNYRFGKNGKNKNMRDEVVEFCENSVDFDEAVKRACASLRPNGKCHNHQSRVPKKLRMFYAQRIIRKMEIVVPDNFDELHDLLEELAPQGIGPVTIYDVATRLGAFMELEVKSLYLHAGVRIGWNLLHGRRYKAVDRVPPEEWPAALRRLPADEVEDMLCAYREILRPELLK